MLGKKVLKQMYVKDEKSMQQIADSLKCSVHKVSYWMDKHKIARREMSDAIYSWHNPNGDPFKFRKPITTIEHQLYGMGLGLYWGEGTKSNQHAIRLGNTDPALLNTFIHFLETFFQVNRSGLKFSLQIFSDINPITAMNYWTKQLKVSKNQFHKPTITKSGSIGTYRNKSQYGVVTVYFSNIKARKLLDDLMPA